MKRLAILFLLLGLVSSPANAQRRIMGWGDGLAGDRDASPDCEQLPPTHTLVVSFIAPPGLGRIQRIDAFVDYCTDPQPLLDWWRFDAGGGCRSDSMTVSADFTSGPSTAVDLWDGQASVDVDYQPEYGGNQVLARLNVGVVPSSGPADTLEAGQEYYAFKVIFGNPPVGCGGCEQPACFIVNGLSLTHEGGVFYTTMDYTNYVRWQDGQPDCPFIVPTKKKTWGGLKTTYD